MAKRAQVIMAPFIIVPLLLLLILGFITIVRGTNNSNVETSAVNADTESTSAIQTVAGVATSTPAPALTDAKPAPTVSGELTQQVDAEDALLTALYRDRSPAVVAIHILGAAAQGTLQLPRIQPDDPNATPTVPEFGFEAQGSGFVLDAQGHIITNNHVVENATTIEVTFTDGSTLEATVVGTDLDSDLAVIKVGQLPDGVQPLPLGDSRKLEVGQRAIAIGNPFGLDSTLTVGVISALGRSMPSRAASQGGVFSLGDVIQTDAAINPGNSGGPLFNSSGEVIGVNTAIRSEGGSFEGVGFAVPSNIVEKVSAAIIKQGRYEHPYLGISMGRPLTEAVARELKLSVQRGVPVGEVVPNGPADKAGLQGGTDLVQVRGVAYPTGGDIVLRIDDEAVTTSSDIIDYLATQTVVGQTITLTVLRDGKEQKVEVVLGARPTGN